MLAEFKKYLKIQRERNEQMKDVSRLLGVDLSFSEEEMVKNAEEQFSRALSKKIAQEVEAWTKLAS